MIPERLHAIWVGSPLPTQFQQFMEGWQRLHPAWAFQMWGEAELASLDMVNRDIYDRADELCPGLSGQLRSDVARLEILYRYGGVYIDTDFECLKPIDDLLEGVDCFAAWVVPGQWLNNAIMGAAPIHPFIGRLIDEMPARIAAYPGQAPRVVSGPQYMTAVWKEHPEGVTLFEKPLFYPYLWSELGRGHERFPGAYGVHHWGNRRRERGKEL